jgi:hypothetical protein
MLKILALHRVRRLLLAVVPALAFVTACDNDVSIDPDVLAGSYTATSFLVTPSGQPTVDVIAKGGALSITVAADSSTTGLLSLPAGVLSSQGGTASMAGVVRRVGDNTFRFDQPSADTFIEALDWQQFTGALVSTSFVANTQFQITLRK